MTIIKSTLIPNTLWDQVKSEVIQHLKKMNIGSPVPQKLVVTLQNTEVFCPISKIEQNDNVFYAMTQEELFAPFLSKEPELTKKIQLFFFTKGEEIVITNIFIGDTLSPPLPWDLSISEAQNPELIYTKAQSFWNTHAYNTHVVHYDKKTATQVCPV